MFALKSSVAPSSRAFSGASRRAMSSQDKIFFGPFEVTQQVFLRTPHCFAVVNLKPLLPGHVLICPLQPHKRLTDLSTPEVTDLFTTTQRVQKMLARHYFKASSDVSSSPSDAPPEAGSFNIALQDGAGAGQTVPHVHVHILPRIPGETSKDPGPKDEIYEQMTSEEGNVGGALWDAVSLWSLCKDQILSTVVAMLTASSPIHYPAPSSPPNPKRPRPVQDAVPRPKAKMQSGFLLEDDSESSDDEGGKEPPLKKILTGTAHPFPSFQQRSYTPQDDSIPVETTRNGDPAPTQTVPVIPPPDSLNLYDGSQVPDLLPFDDLGILQSSTRRTYTIRTSTGKAMTLQQRKPNTLDSYETIIAARTKTKEGRAKRGYYGVDINELKDAAALEISEARSRPRDPENTASEPLPSIEAAQIGHKKSKKSLLWTEKYRARTFMDLCGDDSTNRTVLRWLKRWDPIVFPGATNRAPIVRRPAAKDAAVEEKPHRKILMLTGPPGLGKTTLAHVCARQAGYEVMEINASDDRSRDVVKNRIRTSLGTESVRTVANRKTGSDGQQAKVARPACVIVDEVDGAVSGSGASGEGGFVKALIDLVLLDQKNSGAAGSTSHKKKKGDDFRLMRPLILICNDVYHPSLRPLRQSGLAEVIHVGKPTIESVVTRLKSVFDKEGVPCDKDAARKICEAAWGMATGNDAKRGAQSGAEGDLRGVMVVGEWVAGRYRAAATESTPRLTRQWLDKHVVRELSNGAGGARGTGRGSAKDIVARVFQEGGGFPKAALDTSKTATNQHEQPKAQLGFAEYQKKHSMERLQQMVNTSGEIDKIVTDIMLEYPNREFNDDSFLSKPNEAYDWLQFHDACSSRLFASQDWELAPYLGLPVLACHSLFASPKRHVHEQPKAQLGFAEYQKKHSMERLQQMVNTSGEIDKIVTDIMLEYPNREFNDDSFLSKPNEAYDWLQFHDACSSRLFASQDWELAPYLGLPVLACHSLFASPKRHVVAMGYDKKWGGAADDDAATVPFSGPRADFEAYQAEKENRAMLQAIQAQLSPTLMRSFRSPEDVAAEFLPYLVRLVSPDVKPVVVGGGGDQRGIASVRKDAEKAMVKRAAEIMVDVGITLQRGKIETDSAFNRTPQWVYRLEPDLDALAVYETATSILSVQAPTRYAVRQVLDQELQASIARRENEARQARFQGGNPLGNDVPSTRVDKEAIEQKRLKVLALADRVRKDFFGRVIEEKQLQEGEGDGHGAGRAAQDQPMRVWVSYNEGLNNAVRKPISLQELMRGM
ncbi:hypothetical protein BN1708_013687 [Verticillium longisporum]|uniref:HIT domain-containing protein n=1 Tax=Verticillium longisporum TaxID=100787 RepID=A0A0G4LN47_VERLO|nr:hypothetical protein BN1708_013687 [Verticillium longisporum]